MDAMILDPTIVVMLTACALGFLALVGAMREETTGHRRLVLDDGPPPVTIPHEA